MCPLRDVVEDVARVVGYGVVVLVGHGDRLSTRCSCLSVRGYACRMNSEGRPTSGGVELTEAVLDAAAAEAEAGYALDRLRPRRRVPELVGVSEIREILKINSRQQVNEMANGPDFPEPVQALKVGRVWLRSDIEAFGAQWDRRPGRRSTSKTAPVVQHEPLALVEQFREVLREWTDSDVAMFALGRALGFFPVEGGFDAFQEEKHVFWSNNDLGNALGKMLDALVDEGLMERRDNPEFRWKDGIPPR
jgi:hypothetical protein